MNKDKKNKILNSVLVVLNCIIIYIISSSRWVNRMPSPNHDYSPMEDFYELFLGRGFPTLITAIITVIISYIISKLFIKQEMKFKNYIFLFFIILILNMIIYRIGIGIAV